MNLVPVEEAGVASSVTKTITNISLVIGVCVFGAIFTQVTPANVALDKASLLSAHITPQILSVGFHNAYLFGFVVCLLALIFSYLVKHNYAAEEQPA